MTSYSDMPQKLKDFATVKSQVIDISEQKTIHDRVLVVEGKKFYVQSGLLMVWSEFFQGLFGKDFKEATMKEIEIKDVSAEDFENFLKLIYPGEFVITATNYLGLARLSDRFLAPVVYDKVKEFIRNNFADLDKIDLLKFAFDHDKMEIKELVGTFITCHFGKPLRGNFACQICKMPCSTPPFCIHGASQHPSANIWIHDNIEKIRKLSPEIQCFILHASIGKY